MEISFERTDYLKMHLILNTIYHLETSQRKLCLSSQRKLLTKFCISAHDLEKGRYIGLKAHNRKCKLCKIDIEDECHFLLQCPKLEIERKAFLELINKEYKNFNSLEVNSKCIWLMSSDGFVIQHLYKLLYNSNIKKSSILADGM